MSILKTLLSSHYYMVGFAILSFILAFSITYLKSKIIFSDLWIDISIGSFVSIIFYFINVLYPEYQQRGHLKSNLNQQYSAFKISIISSILQITQREEINGYSDSIAYDVPKKLADNPSECRAYFYHKKDGSSTDRWGYFAGNLDINCKQEIILAMDVFSQNLSFILNKINIADKDVFTFLQKLTAVIYRNRRDSENQKGEESFLRFLSELLLDLDTVSTDTNAKNIVQQMIDNI